MILAIALTCALVSSAVGATAMTDTHAKAGSTSLIGTLEPNG